MPACQHILPAVRGPILVNAAFVAASAVVVESTLSFLGLGPGLSTVSWGMILQQGKLHAAGGAWPAAFVQVIDNDQIKIYFPRSNR